MTAPPASPPRGRDQVVRARRSLRRRLLLGFAPVALVGLAVVAKLLSMYAFAHQSIASHVERNPAGTVAAAQGLLPANWFEAYLAPYDYGVGLATSGELAAARAQFEAALPLATGYDACPVHINLGLVIEMMADEALTDDPEKAAKLYAEALEANLATPDACRSEEADQASPDPERSNEESLDDQQQRLQQKQQEQESNGEPEDDENEDDADKGEDDKTEEEKQEQQEKLDEIEKRLREGEQEREDQGANGDEDEGGYGSDKPW